MSDGEENDKLYKREDERRSGRMIILKLIMRIYKIIVVY